MFLYVGLDWIKTFINREDILHGYINTANGHNLTTDAAIMLILGSSYNGSSKVFSMLIGTRGCART